MGTVYVVEQLSTGKQRALKLMLPQLVSDPSLRKRFEQEARVGGRIESEHVVDVVGAGVDPATGTPWLAMEFLQGEDLATRVQRAGALPPDELRVVLGQVCHAIAAAHDAGVVHRDLKPENIFLAQARRAEVKVTVKVLDFGIAKLVADAGTTATAAIGSPSWMAPEQTARGAAIGPSTDVWPLGLIAFYLLTGHHYFRAAEDESSTLANLLREVVLDPLPLASERARELGLTLPPGFDSWFLHAVVREPQARFGNVRELLAGFERLFSIGDPGQTALPAHAPLVDAYGPGQTLLDDAVSPVAARLASTTAGLHATVPARRSSRGAIYALSAVGALALGGTALALWRTPSGSATNELTPRMNSTGSATPAPSPATASPAGSASAPPADTTLEAPVAPVARPKQAPNPPRSTKASAPEPTPPGPAPEEPKLSQPAPLPPSPLLPSQPSPKALPPPTPTSRTPPTPVPPTPLEATPGQQALPDLADSPFRRRGKKASERQR